MRKKLVLILSYLILGSCSTVDLEKVDNLNGGKIDIIGHAGGGFQSLFQPLPSNSFTNIKNAIDGWSADGMELDLKVTSDSVVVVYHDDILETSTNCAGCPEYYTASEILKCKYKNYYGSRMVNEENLVSFQEVIDHFKNRERPPHIFASTKFPTKCTVGDPGQKDKYVQAVVKLIAENNAYSWISIYDGDVELLNKVKALDPSVDLIYNAIEFDQALDVAVTNNYSGIVIGLDDISKEQVKLAHNNNIKVTIWGTVRRNQVVEAVKKNTDGIMTDNIPLTIEVVRQ